MTFEQAVSAARVFRCLDHATRLRILELLDADVVAWTPKRIATVLEVNLESLAYHVRLMRDAGLLEMTGTRQGRRGAVEHLYVLTPQGRAALELVESVA